MGSVDTPTAAQGLEQTLSRSLISAHLITGTPESAEEAVLRGIDQWNPDDEPEEKLILRIMEAAFLRAVPAPSESTANDSYFKDELKAVLRLEPRLRVCFVLRDLVGLPSQVCAQLLGLLPDEIDEYNVSAMRELALQTELRKPEQPARHS